MIFLLCFLFFISGVICTTILYKYCKKTNATLYIDCEDSDETKYLLEIEDIGKIKQRKKGYLYIRIDNTRHLIYDIESQD